MEYWKFTNQYSEFGVYRVTNPTIKSWKAEYLLGTSSGWTQTIRHNTYHEDGRYPNFKTFVESLTDRWTVTQLSPEEINNLKVALL